ncbi:DUF2894 domain-containing protein, partial [Xanthomonas maliensis]
AHASLATLVAQLREHAAALEADAGPAPAALPGATDAFPELPALDSFRQTWASVRTASQVRQSLQQIPDDAGPLNSAVLVQRCIDLMRERSPDYLQHFLAYVDALAWLEQLHTGGALAPQQRPAVASAARPRGRGTGSRR